MATTAPGSPQDYSLREMLYELPPSAFERLVADLYAAEGWETCVTQASQDGGIDVVATRDDGIGQTALIQAKRYGPDTKVGAREIREYAAVRDRHEQADMMLVVTTGTFTAPAREEAGAMNVKLCDGDDLETMIRRNGLGRQVATLHPRASPAAGVAPSPPSGETPPDGGAPAPSEKTPRDEAARPSFSDGRPKMALLAVGAGLLALATLPAVRETGAGPTAPAMLGLLFGWLLAPVLIRKDIERLHDQYDPDTMPRALWIQVAFWLPAIGSALYGICRWWRLRRAARRGV
jgi:hypothetical protein